MSNRYLVIYLQDHLAGSEAGLRRFQAAAKSNAGTPLGAFLERCVRDLKQERQILRATLRAAGGHRPLMKQSLAFVAEKLSHLKINGHLAKYTPLSRVEDLEALCLGVHGKLRMWKVLHELSRKDGRLAVADFDELYTRAEQQAEELERFRFIAAMQAFKNRPERAALRAGASARAELAH